MKGPRSRVTFVAVLSFLVAAGCQESISGPAEGFDLQPGYALLSGEADVTLRVEADAFAPGAPVTLVLENESGEQVGFNLCFNALERRTGGSWVLELDPRVCTAHLNLLGTGGTAEYETALPSDLAPGEYRFRIALWLMGREEPRDQVSGSFHVDG